MKAKIEKLKSIEWQVWVISIAILLFIAINFTNPVSVESTQGEVVGNIYPNGAGGNSHVLLVKLIDGKTVSVPAENSAPIKLGTHLYISVVTHYGFLNRYYLETDINDPRSPSPSILKDGKTGS